MDGTTNLSLNLGLKDRGVSMRSIWRTGEKPSSDFEGTQTHTDKKHTPYLVTSGWWSKHRS